MPVDAASVQIVLSKITSHFNNPYLSISAYMCVIFREGTRVQAHVCVNAQNANALQPAHLVKHDDFMKHPSLSLLRVSRGTQMMAELFSRCSIKLSAYC